MEVKFLDLYPQYLALKPKIDKFLELAFKESAFIEGEALKNFEKNFSAFTQTKFCVGVGNGTDALEIALKALNLPAGSEIILPANTFFASLEAIINAGYKAVLVDCDENYLIDMVSLKNAITSKTSAIMPVHLYGRSCNMEEILKIAKQHRLKIIEDCSQAHGAKAMYQGELRSVGSMGDVGCFSFYPGKNLGGYGDGGAIVSNDESLTHSSYQISRHGLEKNTKFSHRLIGRNSRLDNLQAGILDIKLSFLPKANAHRQKIAQLYHQALSPIKQLKLPSLGEFEDNHIWHLFVIRLQDEWEGQREELKKYLEDNHIACGVHYPRDLGSLEVVAKHLDCKIHSNYFAKKYCANILSLPMGEHICEEQVAYIAQKISAFSI